MAELTMTAREREKVKEENLQWLSYSNHFSLV